MAEVPLVAGRYRYTPAEGFLIDGVRLVCPPRSHDLLGTIMAGAGRPITREAIAMRLTVDPFDIVGYAKMMVCHTRRHLRTAGIGPLIETVSAAGYRWIGPPVTRMDDAAARA